MTATGSSVHDIVVACWTPFASTTTIGTVSALMAGLAYSSLLYTKMDYFQDATPFVQTMYLLGNVVSMYLALRAMTGTTMIAMFGPGKVQACVRSALRGAPRLSRARIA